MLRLANFVGADMTPCPSSHGLNLIGVLLATPIDEMRALMLQMSIYMPQ